jgi:hypothetical protein
MPPGSLRRVALRAEERRGRKWIEEGFHCADFVRDDGDFSLAWDLRDMGRSVLRPTRETRDMSVLPGGGRLVRRGVVRRECRVGSDGGSWAPALHG